MERGSRVLGRNCGVRMFAFVLMLTNLSWASPAVTATLAPDGYYTVRIIPERPWRAAEMTVAGGETRDLGPASAEEVVLVDGWTQDHQSLRITLQTSGTDGRGRTWMMEIDPFRVPSSNPPLTPKKRPWPFAPGSR